MNIKNLGKENGFWFQINHEINPPILFVSDPRTQKQEYIFGKLDKYQRFCFDLKKFIMGANIKINKRKEFFWFKNGKQHREDGPAVVYAEGSEFWYKNDKYHREDGPAVFFANGNQEWYINGELHRENGPALVYADGSQIWYKNGKLHREDGPAVMYGTKYEYWENGIRL